MKKCEIWTRFLTTVTFNTIWFQKWGTYRKSYTSTLSDDDWTSLWLRHFDNPSPKLSRGEWVKYLEMWPKFSLWGAVISKGSNVSKIRNPLWNRQWWAYLLHKFGLGHSPTVRIRRYEVTSRKIGMDNMLNLPPRSGPATIIYQRLCPRLTCNLDTDIVLSAHPSPIFTMVNTVQNLASIFDPSQI